MFNTHYYDQNEKYSRKHVYIVYFSCMETNKDENTANAALNNSAAEIVRRPLSIFSYSIIYTVWEK